MNIEPNQIKEKKVIGSLKGMPVILTTTKGGFMLLSTAVKGAIKYLATGNHRAIVKTVAEMMEPDVQWELSKSDTEEYIDPKSYAHAIPHYLELTKKANDLIK